MPAPVLLAELYAVEHGSDAAIAVGLRGAVAPIGALWARSAEDAGAVAILPGGI